MLAAAALGGPDLHLLYVLVGVMAAVPVVSGAIGILQVYQTTRVGQLVMRDLRTRLYAHLETLPLSFFTNTKTGEIGIPPGKRSPILPGTSQVHETAIAGPILPGRRTPPRPEPGLDPGGLAAGLPPGAGDDAGRHHGRAAGKAA